MPDIQIPEPNEHTFFIGHERFENEFRGYWEKKQVPHALLLAGPKGIGKATFAYRVARFILENATQNENNATLTLELGDPEYFEGLKVASESNTILQVANKTHPGLMILERSENAQTRKMRNEIVLDDLKGLSDFLHLTAGNDSWRVVIIDSVDEMNIHSSNAILKLLEEPPKQVLFILISNNSGRVLSTIRSRCRQLTFSQLEYESIAKIIGLIVPDVDGQTLDSACRLSEGSVRAALDIVSGGTVGTLEDIVILFDTDLPIDRCKAEEIFEKWVQSRTKNEVNLIENKLEAVIAWLARGVRQFARDPNTVEEVVKGEKDVVISLIGRRGLDDFCERLKAAGAVIERTKQLHLDTKQTFFSVMHTLAGE
ncbi:MAG: hypothetical protein CMM58_02940 [Rhodospirillaceae bacterium]|nr:hypothetical protein [Rhodospirillaceae bacterium]|tara:strand:- start:195 stop:1304 length:1110 start_codon:yes stop_codon:yes gene_type:complete